MCYSFLHTDLWTRRKKYKKLKEKSKHIYTADSHTITYINADITYIHD